jgi:hypothetical protein
MAIFEAKNVKKAPFLSDFWEKTPKNRKIFSIFNNTISINTRTLILLKYFYPKMFMKRKKHE